MDQKTAADLIAEEIQAEQERYERGFRDHVREKLRSIGSLQASIAESHKTLAKLKAELKALEFNPLDASTFQ